MGEREIVVERETTKKELIHTCDFCGRMGDEVETEGDFVTLAVRPMVSLVSPWQPEVVDVIRVGQSNRVSGHGLKFRFESERCYHLCSECGPAFVGTVSEGSE